MTVDREVPTSYTRAETLTWHARIVTSASALPPQNPFKRGTPATCLAGALLKNLLSYHMVG